MQGAIFDVSCHPLRRVGAAECVVVEELLIAGDAEAIEITAAWNVDVDVECRGRFCLGEFLDFGERVAYETDGEPSIGDRDVSGDFVCVGTGCAPVAFVLRRAEGRKGEEGGEHYEELSLTHGLRITSGEGWGQIGGCKARCSFCKL